MQSESSPKKSIHKIYTTLAVCFLLMIITVGLTFMLVKNLALVGLDSKAATAISPSVTPITITPSPTITPLPNISPSPIAIPADKKIPILMYHYVRDLNDPSDKVGMNLSVNPTTFALHLTTLKQAGYTSITFDDLRTKTLPEKPVIITFDDGYSDAYTEAFPTLKAMDMKGVFYVVSRFLNRPRYLTEVETKTMSDAGMQIGSHTTDHHDLSKMTTEMQRQALEESKTALEKLLDKEVADFCYPAGRYNQATLDIVKEFYKTSTTTKPGITTGKDFYDKPHELNRIRITNNTDILDVLNER